MDLSDILRSEDVLPALQAGSKRQVLQALAAHAAECTGLPERAILEALMQRERLGSTAVGEGIAIPHGRFAGLSRVCGLFARLAAPVDFDALDHRPVDIVFMLLAPESAGADHLKALARVSRVLRDRALVEKLHATRDPKTLYALLTSEHSSSKAA